MEKVFEIYIRTTADRLWEAITDPTIRAKYHFGAGVESDWTPGSRYVLTHPAADSPLAEGENLVVEPPKPARANHAHPLERGCRAGRAPRE